MLWKDLLVGFLIDASPWLRVPANALIGPIVAMLTFVCSIGNVPLAAILWGGGATFGGVVAFIYGDLIVIPLLDVYRRYFGWRMAAYLGLVLYASMVGAAILVDLAFTAAGAVPEHAGDVRRHLTTFSVDYTFWLNLAFGVIAVALVVSARRAAKRASHQD